MIGTIIAIAVLVAAALMVASHFRARSRGKAGMLSCKCGGGDSGGCSGCSGCAASGMVARLEDLDGHADGTSCTDGSCVNRR